MEFLKKAQGKKRQFCQGNSYSGQSCLTSGYSTSGCHQYVQGFVKNLISQGRTDSKPAYMRLDSAGEVASDEDSNSGAFTMPYYCNTNENLVGDQGYYQLPDTNLEYTSAGQGYHIMQPSSQQEEEPSSWIYSLVSKAATPHTTMWSKNPMKTSSSFSSAGYRGNFFQGTGPFRDYVRDGRKCWQESRTEGEKHTKPLNPHATPWFPPNFFSNKMQQSHMPNFQGPVVGMRGEQMQSCSYNTSSGYESNNSKKSTSLHCDKSETVCTSDNPSVCTDCTSTCKTETRLQQIVHSNTAMSDNNSKSLSAQNVNTSLLSGGDLTPKMDNLNVTPDSINEHCFSPKENSKTLSSPQTGDALTGDLPSPTLTPENISAYHMPTSAENILPGSSKSPGEKEINLPQTSLDFTEKGPVLEAAVLELFQGCDTSRKSTKSSSPSTSQPQSMRIKISPAIDMHGNQSESQFTAQVKFLTPKADSQKKKCRLSAKRRLRNKLKRDDDEGTVPGASETKKKKVPTATLR